MDSPDLATCSQLMNGSDHFRNFQHGFSRPLVLRIREIPNPDMPMNSPFSGLFPSSRIYATRPLKMDGSDLLSGFWDFRYSDDRNLLSTQNPGSRYADGLLDLAHVSSYDGRLRFVPGFSPWKIPNSCHQESRSHDSRYPDGHASRRDFQPPVHEDLTLMHLLTDPTAVGFF
jgi:hypothetical protein